MRALERSGARYGVGPEFFNHAAQYLRWRNLASVYLSSRSEVAVASAHYCAPRGNLPGATSRVGRAEIKFWLGGSVVREGCCIQLIAALLSCELRVKLHFGFVIFKFLRLPKYFINENSWEYKLRVYGKSHWVSRRYVNGRIHYMCLNQGRIIYYPPLGW